jgi:hypothetical protein
MIKGSWRALSRKIIGGELRRADAIFVGGALQVDRAADRRLRDLDHKNTATPVAATATTRDLFNIETSFSIFINPQIGRDTVAVHIRSNE